MAVVAARSYHWPSSLMACNSMVLLALSILAATHHSSGGGIAAQTTSSPRLRQQEQQLLNGTAWNGTWTITDDDVDAATTDLIVGGANCYAWPGAQLRLAIVLTYVPLLRSVTVRDCHFADRSLGGGINFFTPVTGLEFVRVTNVTAALLRFRLGVIDVGAVVVDGCTFNTTGIPSHGAIAVQVDGSLRNVGRFIVQRNVFVSDVVITARTLYTVMLGALLTNPLVNVSELRVAGNTMVNRLRHHRDYSAAGTMIMNTHYTPLYVYGDVTNVSLVSVVGNVLRPDVYLLAMARAGTNAAGNARSYVYAAMLFVGSANRWTNVAAIDVANNAMEGAGTVVAAGCWAAHFAGGGSSRRGFCLVSVHLAIVLFFGHGELNGAMTVDNNTISSDVWIHTTHSGTGTLDKSTNARRSIVSVSPWWPGSDVVSGLTKVAVTRNRLLTTPESAHPAEIVAMFVVSREGDRWGPVIIAGNLFNVTAVGASTQMVAWIPQQQQPQSRGRPIVAVVNNHVVVAGGSSAQATVLLAATSLRGLWAVAVSGNRVVFHGPWRHQRLVRVGTVAPRDNVIGSLRHIDVFNNDVAVEFRVHQSGTTLGGHIRQPLATFDDDADDARANGWTPSSFTRGLATRVVGNRFGLVTDPAVVAASDPADLASPPASLLTRGSVVVLPLRAPNASLVLFSHNSFVGWHASWHVMTNDTRGHVFGGANDTSPTPFFWEANGPVGPMTNASTTVRDSLSIDPARRSAEFPGAHHVFLPPGDPRRCAFDTQCEPDDSDRDIGAFMRDGECWCLCRTSRLLVAAWVVPPSLQCTVSAADLPPLPGNTTSELPVSYRRFATTTPSLTAGTHTPMSSTTVTAPHHARTASATVRRREPATSSAVVAGLTPSSVTNTQRSPPPTDGDRRAVSSTLTVTEGTYDGGAGANGEEDPGNALALAEDRRPGTVQTAAVSTAVVVTGIGAGVVGPSSIARAGRIGAARRALFCTFDPDDVAPPLAEQPLQFTPFVSTDARSDEFRRLAGASITSTLLVCAAAVARALCCIYTDGTPTPSAETELKKNDSHAVFAVQLVGIAAAVLDGFFVPAIVGNAALALNHAHQAVALTCTVCAALCLASFVVDIAAVFRGGAHWAVVSHESGVADDDDDDTPPALTNRVAAPATVSWTSTPLNFVPTFGLLFDGCRAPLQRLPRAVYVEEVATGIAMAVVTNIRPISADACPKIAASVVAIAVAHIVFVVAVRPYWTRIENGFSLLFGGIQLATAAVGVMELPLTDAVDLVDSLTLVQTALLVAQPVALICHARFAQRCVQRRTFDGDVKGTDGVAAPLLVAPQVVNGGTRRKEGNHAAALVVGVQPSSSASNGSAPVAVDMDVAMTKRNPLGMR